MEQYVLYRLQRFDEKLHAWLNEPEADGKYTVLLVILLERVAVSPLTGWRLCIADLETKDCEKFEPALFERKP